MRFRTDLALLILVTALSLGCRAETESAVDAAGTPPVPPPPPEPVAISEGFQTPESVVYDMQQDVYYVSNINGSPLEADGNGFISRIAAGTLEVESKWIDGASPDVELDAPKGMAIVGDELRVADITRVRRFDRRSGAPAGEIPIPGASFLNDLAAGGEVVYVSDSGLKAGEGGFAPSGTDAIYRIRGTARPERIASGSELNRPNGVEADDGSVRVVTFGAAELFRLENGAKTDVVTLPAGSLDGLVRLDDGTFLVSSWDAGAIYRGPASGPFEPVVEGLDAPADIGFDSKRNLILVPHFNENRVTLQPLEP